MPWTPQDAPRKTRRAKSRWQKLQWARTANAVLKSGRSEASAIKIANSRIKSTRSRKSRRGVQ